MERLGFIRVATVSGWRWLVEVSNHVGLAALIVALAFGVSIFGGWKLPHWWYGLLILIGFYVLLFGEGAYRVHRNLVGTLPQQANELALELEALPPAIHAAAAWSGGFPSWLQLIRVTNNGAGGRFRATLASDIAGVEQVPYGKGVVLAWEQSRDYEKSLGRGDAGAIRVCSGFPTPTNGPDGVFFRLWTPPSPHGGSSGSYEIGTVQPAVGSEVSFFLKIATVDEDVSERFHVHLRFDPFGKPELALGKAPPE